MKEPPRKWMRDTVSIVSGRVWVESPCISHSKPSSQPTTSTPSSAARMVAAPITLLMPGAGPPPTRIASRLRWLTVSSGSADRRHGQIVRELLHHVGHLLVAGLQQEVGAAAVGL